MAAQEETIEHLQAAAFVVDDNRTLTYNLANDGGIFYGDRACIYNDRPVILIPQLQALVSVLFTYPNRPLASTEINKFGYKDAADNISMLEPDLINLGRLTRLGSHIARVGPSKALCRYVFTTDEHSFESVEQAYADNMWPDASMTLEGFRNYASRGTHWFSHVRAKSAKLKPISLPPEEVAQAPAINANNNDQPLPNMSNEDVEVMPDQLSNTETIQENPAAEPNEIHIEAGVTTTETLIDETQSQELEEPAPQEKLKSPRPTTKDLTRDFIINELDRVEVYTIITLANLYARLREVYPDNTDMTEDVFFECFLHVMSPRSPKVPRRISTNYNVRALLTDEERLIKSQGGPLKVGLERFEVSRNPAKIRHSAE